jgi:hypothetical protein
MTRLLLPACHRRPVVVDMARGSILLGHGVALGGTWYTDRNEGLVRLAPKFAEGVHCGVQVVVVFTLLLSMPLTSPNVTIISSSFSLPYMAAAEAAEEAEANFLCVIFVWCVGLWCLIVCEGVRVFFFLGENYQF